MIRKTSTTEWILILFLLLATGKSQVLQPVEDVRVTQVTDSTLEVSWSLPASMVSQLRQFEVCVVEASTGSGDCYLSNEYLLTWGSHDPLRPCFLYNVSVSWRSTDMSQSNTTEVQVNTLPQSVTGLATEEVGTSFFTVFWSLPAESSSCVSGYELYLCASSTGCVLQSNDELPQSTTSYTFSDLEACRSYVVVVTSMADDGTESLNASLTVDTATQDPGAVRMLELSETGSGDVLVTWQTPVGVTTCVDHYSVCGSEEEAGSSPTCLATSNGGATSSRLGGLTSCTLLNISVTPVAAGGQAFQSLSAVIDTGVPSSVRQLTVSDTTSVSVDVTWRAPAENTDCTTGYSVCHRELFSQGDLACSNITTSALQYTLTGLQGATSYDVYVAALGGHGTSSKYAIVRATTGYVRMSRWM